MSFLFLSFIFFCENPLQCYFKETQWTSWNETSRGKLVDLPTSLRTYPSTYDATYLPTDGRKDWIWISTLQGISALVQQTDGPSYLPT